jgi:hypothetical protein
MSGVFRNIDPPPPHRPASVYYPAFGAVGGHTRKTIDTALYSIYVSTLWCGAAVIKPIHSILKHISLFKM